MVDETNVKLTLEGAIRKDILQAALKAGKTGAHIAPSLSLVEILSVIVSKINDNNGIIVMSKAHGALGYYAAMHQIGMITDEQFASFESNGGEFPGQPSRSTNNNVTYSGGSLGMGLPYAAGRAWAIPEQTVYVILGDGELDEGSNWEAASVIAKNNLKNVVAVVDCNGLQSDGECKTIQNNDLKKIWEGHNWKVIECDGHNVAELEKFISRQNDKPTVILAKTIKGKGVSFMEGQNEWHHHTLKEDQYSEAIAEIEVKYGLR